MPITRIAAAVTAGVALTTVLAAPAQAAPSCRVLAPTHLDNGRVVLRIASSQPTNKPVHTYNVVVDTDFGPVSWTWKNRPPNLVVNLGDPIVAVHGTQAGTGCRRWTP